MAEAAVTGGRQRWLFSSCIVAACLCVVGRTPAQDSSKDESNDKSAAKFNDETRFGSRPVLTPDQWKKLDPAVDRALAFVSSKQNPDGSFPTAVPGQPAVTALCVMAFLSRGHLPNEGPYGKQISHAIDYVLSTQQEDGTLMLRKVNVRGASFEGNYNHAIAGIMLSEVHGMVQGEQQQLVHAAIEKGLRLTRQQQQMPKRDPNERGGWRYMRRFGVSDSDLSVTGWQLMFLRSARNAEFNVPEEWTDEAMGYIRRSFNPAEKGFMYGLHGEDRYCSRGTVGAGVVALALGGEHNSEIAKEAGKWILRNDFGQYNRSRHPEDKYHYSAFYCSQAMYQLGGEYWFQFFPGLLDVLTQNQNEDGSWDTEANAKTDYGNVYSTALTVLTLTPPYQILPIYQR